MNQKEIYIDPALGFETEKMIRMYFAVKTVNGIEGFIFTEEEFLKKHKNTYAFNDLRLVKFHAIYSVDNCEICNNSFEVSIYNRMQLSYHLNSSLRLCNACKICQASTSREPNLRLNKNGDN